MDRDIIDLNKEDNILNKCIVNNRNIIKRRR